MKRLILVDEIINRLPAAVSAITHNLMNKGVVCPKSNIMSTKRVNHLYLINS